MQLQMPLKQLCFVCNQSRSHAGSKQQVSTCCPCLAASVASRSSSIAAAMPTAPDPSCSFPTMSTPHTTCYSKLGKYHSDVMKGMRGSQHRHNTWPTAAGSSIETALCSCFKTQHLRSHLLGTLRQCLHALYLYVCPTDAVCAVSCLRLFAQRNIWLPACVHSILLRSHL